MQEMRSQNDVAKKKNILICNIFYNIQEQKIKATMLDFGHNMS